MRRTIIGTLGVAVLCAAVVASARAAESLPTKPLKMRVAVTSFKNKSGYTPRDFGDLGTGMTEMLVESLLQSGHFIVVERQELEDVLREQEMSRRGLTQPGADGRHLTSAQIHIKGTITEFDEQTSSKRRQNFIFVKKTKAKRTANVAVNIRLIDTASGEILRSMTVHGTSTVTNKSYSGGFMVEMSRESTERTPAAAAVRHAVTQATMMIVDQLERVPWQATVIRVSGDEVYVNAGADSGVRPGMVLTVFEPGEQLVDPSTNEILGQIEHDIGSIRIDRVMPRFSIAKRLSGEGLALNNIVKFGSTGGLR